MNWKLLQLCRFKQKKEIFFCFYLSFIKLLYMYMYVHWHTYINYNKREIIIGLKRIVLAPTTLKLIVLPNKTTNYSRNPGFVKEIKGLDTFLRLAQKWMSINENLWSNNRDMQTDQKYTLFIVCDAYFYELQTLGTSNNLYLSRAREKYHFF